MLTIYRIELEVLFSYLGEPFVESLAEIDRKVEEGSVLTRGLTLLSCGPAVRNLDSFSKLRALVEL